MEMLESRSAGLRCVVLSIILGLLLPSLPLRADDAPPDLPPPPESADSGLTPIDAGASVGADLPPPPPGAPDTPSDATAVATPPGEEIPPMPLEGDPKDQAASSDAPQDTGLSDVPADVPVATPDMVAASPDFSSSSELKNISMKDRVDAKNLVLWLSLGPSYGTLTSKGSFVPATSSTVAGAGGAVGGLGYNAGLGFMIDSNLQLQFDFTGTPKTKSSTVDQAMFGIGPRLGFLTLMGTFGVQAGPDASNNNAISQIFAIGARAGLDLILKHGSDSRTSVGLAPEVYFITPQGADGYTSAGISVSLRIYGYDNAF